MREIPFGRPWITEEDKAAIAAVLDGPILTHGPACKALEEEFGAFLGAGPNGESPHCVTTSSCMAALHLAYLRLGIGPGDEVVVPAQTHVATVHAVEAVGATPVFADCDAATGNVTPETIEPLLTPKTRAISVVHFVGIPCDMRGIMELARKHDLRVIEDCALAVGARIEGVHVGLWGDAGCFSFYPVKHLTTAEGGMFVTRCAEVAEGVRRLRGFGVDRTHEERKIPGMYDVTTFGLNYRMSELQAALGRSQLRRVAAILDVRRKNFRALREALCGGPDDVPGCTILDGPGSSHYCFVAVVGPTRRDRVLSALARDGIGASIYYPHPVPRLTYYRKKYGYDAKRFPCAEAISDGGIALPVGPHLAPDDVERIAASLRAAMTEAAEEVLDRHA